MAQIKPLKIDVDGVPVEVTPTTDDVTFNSYSVQGGGPVLSATGLNLNTQPISALTNVTFVDPTSNTINQTAGVLKIDNLMGKDRSNLLTTAGEILFPTVTNTSGQIDNFRIPTVAGAPTATPTNTGAGFMVYDSTGLDMYVWTGTAWHNQDVVNAAAAIDDVYTAGVAINARDVVYISAADNVSQAVNTAAGTSQAVGLAIGSAALNASASVMKYGRMTGFTGLTAGARYYLASTAGTVAATVPATSGASIVQIGYAKNATTLDIQIQQLGRRS